VVSGQHSSADVLMWMPVCCRDNEFEEKTRASMKRMNYVSAQLMKGRDRGAHANYLHRLYAEGLEDLEKKRRQVRLARGLEAMRND